MFEIPLQNMVVAPGADVLLKCIITANPPPQGEPRGGLEAARCGGEHVVWEQGRFPGILLYQGGEEEDCQFTGLPELCCIRQGCLYLPSSGVGSLSLWSEGRFLRILQREESWRYPSW